LLGADCGAIRLRGERFPRFRRCGYHPRVPSNPQPNPPSVMSIAVAERLKRELTDKFVVVAKNVPELRRFAGLTGIVKTVNMNGRALVQFDGPEDISWYDIEPSYLIVVDQPLPKKEPAAKQEDPAGKKSNPAATTVPKKPSGGKSPLELAREQAAGGKPAARKPGLSPLEQARAQAGGTAKPAAAPRKAGLSPLEQARQQGAGGGEKAEEPVAEAPPAETPAAAPPAKSDVDVSKLSPLERARLQGGGKR
jgi:hypothetical protein